MESQESDVLEIPIPGHGTFYTHKKEWEAQRRYFRDVENSSKKNDFLDNKPRWDLLPLDLIAKVVDVYTAGAKKYGDNNWQGLDNGYARYKAALFRHILAYESGEAIDKETGCEHLAQAAWNALAMLYFSHKNDK